MIHKNIKVYGRVQGVFFRAFAKESAESFNLAGFAKNDPDGVVYIEVEGSQENLDQFINWCQEGSLLSKVERVEVFEGEVQNYEEFKVL